MRAAWVVVACACAQALVAPTTRVMRPRVRRCAAASPAHALAERPRRRLRRRLRRSAIGLGAGAGVVLLGGGRGSALYWSLVPALLPWTPAFDTARLVVLFMRAARVDILEQRFRVEATAFSDPPEALTHPRPRSRGASGAWRPRPRGVRAVGAASRRSGAPVHERFDLVCGTSIGGAGALFMAHLDRPLAEAREASDQMREACFVGASSWRLLVRGYAARRAPGEVVSARVGPDRPLLAPAAGAAPPAAARLDLPTRSASQAPEARGRRRGEARAARIAAADADGLEDAAFTERLFRSLGLSWEHEPRIRRAARRALDKRGATYVRLEPPLEGQAGLSRTADGARARGAVATLPDSVGRVTALFEPRKPEATRWPKATAFRRSR
ncbi:hypothetical protein JL722_5034 [Aureococcus anophagefferens]|nr:hypothetical protein JL722_5034 [Aureococcus anophagefferens]